MSELSRFGLAWGRGAGSHEHLINIVRSFEPGFVVLIVEDMGDGRTMGLLSTLSGMTKVYVYPVIVRRRATDVYVHWDGVARAMRNVRVLGRGGLRMVARERDLKDVDGAEVLVLELNALKLLDKNYKLVGGRRRSKAKRLFEKMLETGKNVAVYPVPPIGFRGLGEEHKNLLGALATIRAWVALWEDANK